MHRLKFKEIIINQILQENSQVGQKVYSENLRTEKSITDSRATKSRATKKDVDKRPALNLTGNSLFHR